MATCGVRGDEGLSLYLGEIGRIPLMSREEELACARRAAAGEPAARAALVRANLRFVVLVAKKYRHCGLPLEDLVNEGNLGLLQAAERFDADRGCRFISYAVWWIRQAMVRAIRLQRETGRGEEPQVVSLDAPLGDEADGARLADRIGDRQLPDPQERLDGAALKDGLARLLDTLPEREAGILRARYGLNGEKPASLQELGGRYRLAKERVRQIEKHALRRLRGRAAARRLHDYLN